MAVKRGASSTPATSSSAPADGGEAGASGASGTSGAPDAGSAPAVAAAAAAAAAASAASTVATSAISSLAAGASQAEPANSSIPGLTGAADDGQTVPGTDVDGPVDTDGLWTSHMDYLLFQSCITHKPAGVHKHFQMALIHKQLKAESGIEISPKEIWNRLSKFFNLSECDRVENAVDARDDSWQEFQLPRKEFGSIIGEMRRNGQISGASDQLKESGPAKKSSSSKEKEDSKESTETLKAGNKRPTRSTPGSTPAKRRK